jgi:predicted TIM-barrel fold metal-dependent hydrolase
MMWSTDFPHVVTRWPNSLQTLESQMAGVPPEERWQIAAGNAIKFFHLDHKADGKESKSNKLTAAPVPL